jgi:prepilin signal peptidase PulO-like enzyme (type II secretory pathway)
VDEMLPLWLMLFTYSIAIIWGLALGSFTTCVVYRVPRKISLWRNTDGSYRSFCPSCHAELHSKDLIPVFSWLYQKGRCRYCSAPIPVRYLLIELVILFLVIFLFWALGISIWFFACSLLIPVIAGFGSFLLFKGKL